MRIRTERGERRRLDVKSKEWDGLMRGVKEAMGGMQPSEWISCRYACMVHGI